MTRTARRRRFFGHVLALALILLASASPIAAADNRITHLDGSDPYYVGRHYPKLITPQWVGEEGVEAVVILGIDDMREPKKYETFLRPILNRLKKIDGRAPLSIMTCQVKPDDEQLQSWLKEGLSLETHTIDHPCPLLTGGDFGKAKSTYDRCVDLMNEVPNSKPVAFRTPCCDSLNTVSPRIYAEIFNKTTAKGRFLTIDTSVFNLFTANDPELPRDLVLEPNGRERFRKYLPTDRAFVNYVEDYPYPYVIGGTCWEFPCVVPSDWSAQHYHKPNNPVTVRDWQAALDATVVKKGVFCLVFHPHGWIKNEQIVDLIDHAVTKHGKKVKFLTFREAQERLDKNVLGGFPLRDPKTGATAEIGLSGLDGRIMVTRRDKVGVQFRVWKPETGWSEIRSAQTPKGDGKTFVGQFIHLRLGDKTVIATCTGDKTDFDVFDPLKREWSKPAISLPPGVVLGDGTRDAGVRFVDLDEDGSDDIVFSNEKEYGVYLFTDMEHGWSQKVIAGKAGEPGALPPIAKNGTNNGFFVHSRSLWWQNENTNLLPDHLDRRSFNDLLMTVEPTAKSPEASLRCIKTRPGFTVELVAAEPLVQSPIAFAWGPDGKLWVVEMGDYPLGVDGKGKPGGRVKFLEDTKGTGKYDKATVFLDNLPFPTGVLPWRKGVLVTCAPDIFYAEDTKGTGKADLRVPLFTGFREGNQQHRVNGLVWGLDNWIYGANGDSGGLVVSTQRKQVPPLDLRGRDLRIQARHGRDRPRDRPDAVRPQPRRLGQLVRQQQQLADVALRARRPLPPPQSACRRPRPRVQISETPGAVARLSDQPHAAAVQRSEGGQPLHVGVQRHRLPRRTVRAGVRQQHVRQRAGPQPGSPRNHAAQRHDVYQPPCGRRAAVRVPGIERQLVPADDDPDRPGRRPLDRRHVSGRDRASRVDPEGLAATARPARGPRQGPIYRVYPVGTKPRAIPRLDKLDTAGLVAALDSPSGWQRDTAQQMLYWSQDKAAVPLLEKLAADSERPLARLHALCTLDGLDALRPASVKRALADAHPSVRQHAVRLCERHLAQSPELGAALLKLMDDADPHVRLQLAYTLGEWADPRAGGALGRLLLQEPKDRFLTAAGMSSVNARNLDAVLLAVLAGDPQSAVVGRPRREPVADRLRGEADEGAGRAAPRRFRSAKG